MSIVWPNLFEIVLCKKGVGEEKEGWENLNHQLGVSIYNA